LNNSLLLLLLLLLLPLLLLPLLLLSVLHLLALCLPQSMLTATKGERCSVH
jgi:hypothetical protein